MTAVDHDSWNIFFDIVVFLAKETLFFIKELVDELIDLFAIEIGDVF